MTYHRLVAEIETEFPGFQVVEKSESLLMRVISVAIWVLTFGQASDFMTGPVTTLGRTVYVPEDWNRKPENYRISTLRHERVHLRQSRAWGFVTFALLYLLAPLPFGLAWFRARFEWEAYEESMRADYELYGKLAIASRDYKEGIVRLFLGPEYGWMWPFRGKVEAWYDDALRRILSERDEVEPRRLLH
jgi:hypothetical protein